MIDYGAQVAAAARAVVIRSPTTYTWQGRPTPALPRQVERALTPSTARGYLVASLQSRLYRDFYCRGGTVTGDQTPIDLPSAQTTPFLETLSAANRCQDHWQAGWDVRAVENGDVVVHRNGLTVWANPDECRSEDGGSVVVGSRVSVRHPKEWPHVSPGFYLALGDRPLPELTNGEGDRLLRIYWHLTADAASAFVDRATSRLNGAGVPFRLKVARDPVLFTRCDAGVIYLPRQSYPAAAQSLAVIQRALRAGLRPTPPAFTLRLAHGVGLAEDPAGGDSFGLDRCRLLAEGLVRAFEEGKRSTAERVATVAERFAETGIDLERPFLDRDGRDRSYDSWSDDSGHD